MRKVSRILLAEDDETMRMFLCRSLEKAGYEVVTVSHGAEAIPHLTEEKFDQLLTNIVMPGMDGIELARQATVMHTELSVMFITGFAAVPMDRTKEHPKSSNLLQKPFHRNELVE